MCTDAPGSANARLALCEREDKLLTLQSHAQGLSAAMTNSLPLLCQRFPSGQWLGSFDASCTFHHPRQANIACSLLSMALSDVALQGSSLNCC